MVTGAVEVFLCLQMTADIILPIYYGASIKSLTYLSYINICAP